MGHNGPTVTMRVYYRFIPDAAPDADTRAFEKFGA